ncbi:MAG: DUF928 domain-containing protein [Elainellaceae cyanobacterium]
MMPSKQFRRADAFGLSMAALLACATWVSQVDHPARARTQAPNPPLKISFQQPNTAETSAPRDRPRGGGTRPICSEEESQLGRCNGVSVAALVPFPEQQQPGEDEQSVTIYHAWGQTLEPAPTIWFYVPYPPEAIHSADFELLDEQHQLVAQGTGLEITATPGVIRYTPELDVPLVVGKTYRWNLLLRFDPLEPAADELVSGRIKRVAPSTTLRQQLDGSSSALQQASLLGEAGIWYDMVTMLSTVYAEHSAAWVDLLRSVGLEAIADEPLVDCCDD